MMLGNNLGLEERLINSMKSRANSLPVALMAGVISLDGKTRQPIAILAFTNIRFDNLNGSVEGDGR